MPEPSRLCHSIPDSNNKSFPSTLESTNVRHTSTRGTESASRYKPGGYHPIHLRETYHGRYQIIHKLGFGAFSTVWLASGLSSAKTRYVALKFIVSSLTDQSNDVEILQYLSRQPKHHVGFRHVIHLLDQFKVVGPNGIHDVLILEVLGPTLAIFTEEVWYGEELLWTHARRISKEVAMGLEYLHSVGITHADLHFDNVAFSMGDLDGQPEQDILNALGDISCRPIELDVNSPIIHSPRYLVHVGTFSEYMTSDWEVGEAYFRSSMKIIDFGQSFVTTNQPSRVHTPLSVRAPESVFNKLSHGIVEKDWGSRMDTWSLGCMIFRIAFADSLFLAGSEESLIGKFVLLCGSFPEDGSLTAQKLHTKPLHVNWTAFSRTILPWKNIETFHMTTRKFSQIYSGKSLS